MFLQRRGWEPEAILNWLALAGWGVQHEVAPENGAELKIVKGAPDSTKVMNLSEMIAEVSADWSLVDAHLSSSSVVRPQCSYSTKFEP